eukprot:603322-Pelagomonas_calceolata.AAC.3
MVCIIRCYHNWVAGSPSTLILSNCRPSMHAHVSLSVLRSPARMCPTVVPHCILMCPCKRCARQQGCAQLSSLVACSCVPESVVLVSKDVPWQACASFTRNMCLGADASFPNCVALACKDVCALAGKTNASWDGCACSKVLEMRAGNARKEASLLYSQMEDSPWQRLSEATGREGIKGGESVKGRESIKGRASIQKGKPRKSRHSSRCACRGIVHDAGALCSKLACSARRRCHHDSTQEQAPMMSLHCRYKHVQAPTGHQYPQQAKKNFDAKGLHWSFVLEVRASQARRPPPAIAARQAQ